MKRVLLPVLLALAVLLGACQALVYQTTPPPPVPWRVRVSPDLAWLGPVFNTCVRQPPLAGNAAILLDVLPALAAGANYDFSYFWDTGAQVDGPNLALAGQLNLVLIVNPANTLSQIDLPGLQAIFSGKVADWGQVCPQCARSGPLQLLLYPEGSETGQAFDSAFPGLNTRPAPAVIAPDPQTVRAEVARSPGAIGFVPSAYLDSSVRALPLSAADPSRLRFPILVSSASQPAGLQLAWLLCVQDHLNQ